MSYFLQYLKYLKLKKMLHILYFIIIYDKMNTMYIK